MPSRYTDTTGITPLYRNLNIELKQKLVMENPLLSGAAKCRDIETLNNIKLTKF